MTRAHVAGLATCRRQMLTSTMNVRTVRLEDRKEELQQCFSKQRIDILGLQEHRIVHEDTPVRYEEMLGNTLITTSAWRNSAGAAQGGVGILISSRVAKCLAGVKSISPRVLRVNFTGNPACTIIVGYAPTSNASEEECDAFYGSLQQEIESVPAHNALIITADMNAKIGKDVAPHVFNMSTNSNGERLIKLAQENNFIVTNIRFQKRQGNLWTWIDPGGGKHQLDYILVRRKWQNSVKDVEAYNSFASVGSDHRIVTMKFKVSLRSNQNPKPKTVMYDWKAFRADTELQEQYSIQVKNRYDALVKYVGDTAVTTQYEQFMKANHEATEQLVQKRKKVKGNPISGDIRVQQAREKVKLKYNNYAQDSTDDASVELKEAKAELSSAFNTA